MPQFTFLSFFFNRKIFEFRNFFFKLNYKYFPQIIYLTCRNVIGDFDHFFILGNLEIFLYAFLLRDQISSEMPNKLCLSEISTFHDQCDQIGIFLKGLGNIFSNKCSSIIWQLFQKYDFLSKVYRDYFLVNIFKKIGRIFISSSGHTDHASNE